MCKEVAEVLAMGEKGGKGFSFPKSSFKSTFSPQAPLTGKDDSSIKAKKGRKVQFDSEDSSELSYSPKSGGKSETVISKGDGGKGGKGGKVANGGKRSAPKESQPLQLRLEKELPKNTKCFMDCEAAQILQAIQEQMVVLSEDPSIKLPVSFDKGLQYAKSTSHYTNPQSVRQALETPTAHDVSDGEICVIANVCPETTEDVFAFVPSLKAKRSMLEQPLKDVLTELAEFEEKVKQIYARNLVLSGNDSVYSGGFCADSEDMKQQVTKDCYMLQ